MSVTLPALTVSALPQKSVSSLLRMMPVRGEKIAPPNLQKKTKLGRLKGQM